MTTALGRSPLRVGKTYVDRVGRRWRVDRVTNAGRADLLAARLESMALATCIEPGAAAAPETRHDQWLFADTGQWFAWRESATDLVRAA